MTDTKKHWEFTGEVRMEFGVELKQIRATCDFKFASKGDLGGWISDAVTLAQDGLAWISPNAKAFNAIIMGGEIWGGEIWGGEIWGGEIWGGVIWGGVIRGGEIRGGEIWGGEIWGGEIWGGVIRGGVIRGGEIWGGVIRGGEIRGGEIMGGVIRGGVIRGGEIRGGEIMGGEIRGGEIWGGDFITIFPIGSENGIFTATITAKGGIICNRGCFSGTLEEFESAVDGTHAGNASTKSEYDLVIQLTKSRLGKIAEERKANQDG